MNDFQCPACGCNQCTILGVLGDRLHMRCRGCGLDSSTDTAALDQPACVGCEGGSHSEAEGRR